MIRWLSRRDPRYIRSLVYMLQASEYYLKDFYRWHERVLDFRNVEVRKKLKFTPKALALYVFGWFMVLGVVGAAVYAFALPNPWNYVVAAILIVEIPMFVMMGIVGALSILNIIQMPVEWIVIAHAQKKLLAMKAARIAIAGSFGKTSMREILKAVLSEGKNVAAPGGSHNTPLAIAKFIRGLKGDEDVIVFELGEYYPGDVRRLCEFVMPQWGIVTGVNEAHLERFGTLEKTRKTIFELGEFLSGKPLYVNKESEPALVQAPEGSIFYDRHGAGSWKVENPEASLEGTEFDLSQGTHRIHARTRMLGLHSVGPISAAADIASRLGLPADAIEKGVGKTKPFAHRMEPKASDGVVTIDDSYNGNPDGVRAAIEFLKSLRGVRRIFITPGLVEMGAKSKEVHVMIGRELSEARLEKVILIKNSVTPHIAAGIKSGPYDVPILWFEDALTAYRALPTMTVAGDVVLMQNDWPDQYA